jgi:hypothetical protein
MTWGKNAPVVHMPATDPIDETQDISIAPNAPVGVPLVL